MKKLYVVIGLIFVFMSLECMRREIAEETQALAQTNVQTGDLVPAQDKFDVEKKRRQTIALVDRAAKYLKDNPFDLACSKFSHDSSFIQGDLYIFLYDFKGVCYAHGGDNSLIWRNMISYQDKFGAPVVRQMINTAEKGSGWVTYEWLNATKTSFIKRVKKDGQDYAIGAGYFPHSKSTQVVNLVKGAVALFTDTIEKGNPAQWAFSKMSYPLGSFVLGDLYLYALDGSGVLMAQGELPGLIGTNVIDNKDAQGKFINREIIKSLNEATQGEGIWIDYISKNAPKKAYAEKVTDEKGNSYYIVCGYYPDANRDEAMDLVRRGYKFIKANGLSKAVEEFETSEFKYGDLYLFLIYASPEKKNFDSKDKGTIAVDGRNPALNGKNMWEDKDQRGNYYIQEMYRKARNGGGWINWVRNNAFVSTYVELVDLGIEEFIIGTNFYPISKHENMTLLVESAVSYLEANSRVMAFEEFAKPSGLFRRGDLWIYVLDMSGIAFVYGDHRDLIWKNLASREDQQGRTYIQMILNQAKQGSGTIDYMMRSEERISYFETVKKNEKEYVVGSGYYK